MSQDYAELLKTAVEDIKFLQKLRKDVDPASCMSIGVRRGVPQDNDDVEDDATRRPWRTMTFSGGDTGTVEGMHSLIDALIRDRLRSLQYWREACIKHSAAIDKAVNDVDRWIKETPL